MEGSIKASEKIHPMNKPKMADHKFLYNFVLYSLTSLITCFFFSYPFWLPSMKHLVSSLPTEIPLRMDAKCFFLVGNIIVLILIRESRLGQSSSSQSNPALDMYNEYVARSQGYRKPAANSYAVHSKKIKHETSRVKKLQLQGVKNVELEKGDVESVKMGRSDGEEKKREILEEKMEEMRSVCKSTQVELAKRDKTKGEKVLGQNDDVHREELNKRVEAFIARVNKQRFLEAKLVDRIRG